MGSKAREDDRRGVRLIELAGHPCEQQHGWAVCVCVLQVRSDLYVSLRKWPASAASPSATALHWPLHSGAKLCTEYATESEMADTQLYGTMGRAAHSGAVTGVSHGRIGYRVCRSRRVCSSVSRGACAPGRATGYCRATHESPARAAPARGKIELKKPRRARAAAVPRSCRAAGPGRGRRPPSTRVPTPPGFDTFVHRASWFTCLFVFLAKPRREASSEMHLWPLPTQCDLRRVPTNLQCPMIGIHRT